MITDEPSASRPAPDGPRRPAGAAQATIRDVAALAEVAVSSVSRALSGHPDVSDGMRERVVRAAEQLGYQPDFRGQSLRRGRTRTIGFVFRDISNPLFANIARRCEHDLRVAGYAMLITSSDGDPDVEVANLRLLRSRRVDGVIASLVSETAPGTRTELGQYSVPVVLLDREIEGLELGAVLNDHYGGVRDAAAHLLRTGHTRIALVTGALDVRSSRERLRALVDACAEAGVPAAPELQAFGTFDPAFAETEVLRMLDAPDRPTAILTGGVGPTVGALGAARRTGLRVGEDLTVVALDEWPGFDVVGPAIPSVFRDPDEMGAAAAAMMLAALDGAPAQVEVVGTRFRLR